MIKYLQVHSSSSMVLPQTCIVTKLSYSFSNVSTDIKVESGLDDPDYLAHLGHFFGGSHL